MNSNPEVTAYIEKASAEHQEILEELRALIFNTVDGIEEYYKWSRPVYGFSTNEVYLQHSKKHVTLGFMNGTSIPDELGILEGSGKDLRHIKIRTKADIKVNIFTQMLQSIKYK